MIGAIIWKPLDRLDRPNTPKRAVLQVKSRRAGIGLAALYFFKKKPKRLAKKAPFRYENFFITKSEELGMYRTFYTDTHALLPLPKKESVEI